LTSFIPAHCKHTGLYYGEGIGWNKNTQYYSYLIALGKFLLQNAKTLAAKGFAYLMVI